MKKKYYYILFFLVATFATKNNLQASHIMGGYLTYEYLSPLKYKFKIYLYRDCRGVPAGQTIFEVRKGNTGYNVSTTRKHIKEVTRLCYKDTGKYCSPPNTATGKPGQEEHYYEAIVDFNQAPYSNLIDTNNCMIHVSVQECCRNGSITTITAGNFYVGLDFNPCLKNNNGPSITEVPFFTLTSGSNYKLNLGGYDPDGDSLSYQLSCPLQGQASCLNYNSNYSVSNPLTTYCPNSSPCTPNPNANPPHGYYLNPTNGDFVFRPVVANEVSVTNILISSWRKNASGNYQLVSKTGLDFQVAIIQGTNNNTPVAFSDSMEYHVALGSQICIDLKTVDSSLVSSVNVADTTYMSFSELSDSSYMGNATLSISDSAQVNRTFTFCWTPQDSILLQKGYIEALFTVRDDNCPLYLYSNKKIKFYITKQTSNPVSWQPAQKNLLSIYPNPSDGTFAVNHNLTGIVSYTLTAMDGKPLYYGTLDTNQSILDFSLVQNGVYIFTYMNNGVSQSQVLMIVR